MTFHRLCRRRCRQRCPHLILYHHHNQHHPYSLRLSHLSHIYLFIYLRSFVFHCLYLYSVYMRVFFTMDGKIYILYI